MRCRHGEWHCRSVFVGSPCPAQRHFFVSASGIRLLRRLHQSLSRAPTNWPHVIAPCLLSATALLASPFSTTCLTLAVVRRYSSLLSALGGPLVPPSPAAAVALVGHLSNMRNDQSRLRAAAAVVGAGSLTASGHLRVLEAAACAGAPHLLLPLHDVTRLHPQMRFGMRRYLPRVILKTVCWNGCASARRTSLRASAALCPRCWPTTTCSSTAQAIPFACSPCPRRYSSPQIAPIAHQFVSDGIAIFCVLAVHAPWTRPLHKRVLMQPTTLSDRLSNLHIVLALCTKMHLPVFVVAEQLAAPRPQ